MSESPPDHCNSQADGRTDASPVLEDPVPDPVIESISIVANALPPTSEKVQMRVGTSGCDPSTSDFTWKWYIQLF